MMKVIRQRLYAVVMWLRGIVWQSEDKMTTLYRSGWVVMTDGISKDAMPFNMCSEEFICRVLVDLGEGKWVHCSPELLKSGISCADTPRRPCQCEINGSHDHFVATT